MNRESGSRILGTAQIRHIWWLYAGLLFLLGVPLVVSLWYLRERTAQSVYAETRTMTAALDELNRRQFEAMTLPLEFIGQEIDSLGGMEAISTPQLEGVLKYARKTMDLHEMRGLVAIDKNGIIRSYNVTFPDYKAPTPRFSEDWNYLKTQKNYTILPPVISPYDQKRVFLMAKTLHDTSGRFSGVLIVSKALENFEKFYQNLELPFRLTFAVYREDGKLIYRHPQIPEAIGKQITFSKDIHLDSEGIFDNTSRMDGAEKIGYYKFVPEFGDVIFVSYDADQVFATWMTITEVAVGLLLLFMAILALLIAILQKRQNFFDQAMAAQAQREEILRRIQSATESLIGLDFLVELSAQISQFLEIENVAIGVYLPEHSNSVKFVVNWMDGQCASEFIYDLSHSPFENRGPGEFFIYPRAVSRIFPEDPLLNSYMIESCMGMILQDSEQKPSGVFMVYGRQPIQAIALKKAVVSYFAPRVGAELERLRTDELRREVEILRKQIEERALQSEKLQSIGSLAGGIAHDFNNILAIILASVDKLISDHRADSKDQRYFESIKKACHRARHLVAQILIFSQKDNLETQTLQVKRIFAETMDFLRSTLSSHIHLSLDMGECGELSMVADLSQLQQALLNLCVNMSRSFGSGGGDIRIQLRQVAIKDKDYLKWSLHYICDETGSEIEKVFDPFYTQNLGLVLVQKIISNHHGFVEVRGGNEQGTTFDIFLPVAAPEIAAVSAEGYNFKNALRVMIVDDEPEIGLLIRELLEIEGLQVECYTDPSLALQAFLEHQELYSLIISDLSMPKISGIEFAKLIRERNRGVSLILWSGYFHFMDEDVQHLNVKWLSKPVDVPRLLSLIHSELSQQQAKFQASPEISV